MNVALIVPTKFIDSMCTGRDVQMALAHMVLESDEYRAAYWKLTEAGSYIILDNSLIELGAAMTIEQLARAAQMIGADEVILPDAFRDADETLRMTEAALKAFSGVGADHVRFMAVVHGADNTSWLHCFDEMVQNPRIDVLGLPKVLDEIWSPGGRVGCCSYLEATGRISQAGTKQFHALGIWTDPIEVLMLRERRWLRSIDTALPFHAGMHGVRFNGHGFPRGIRPKRPRRYFDVQFPLPGTTDGAHALEAISYNIQVLDVWATP